MPILHDRAFAIALAALGWPHAISPSSSPLVQRYTSLMDRARAHPLQWEHFRSLSRFMTTRFPLYTSSRLTL